MQKVKVQKRIGSEIVTTEVAKASFEKSPDAYRADGWRLVEEKQTPTPTKVIGKADEAAKGEK